MLVRIAVLLALLITTVWATKAYAEPILSASDGNARVTIYEEKCARDEVTNLSNRATWEEKGKVNEGCAAYRPDLGVVIFWFDDKTVTVIPAAAFGRVTGT